jgi:hypothetical protein
LHFWSAFAIFTLMLTSRICSCSPRLTTYIYHLSGILELIETFVGTSLCSLYHRRNLGCKYQLCKI